MNTRKLLPAALALALAGCLNGPPVRYASFRHVGIGGVWRLRVASTPSRAASGAGRG